MVVQLFANPIKGRQKVKKMIYCANNVSLIENSTDFRHLVEDGTIVPKKGWIEDFTADSAVFTDGTSEKVDVVMFCTGYALTFPFLDPADEIIYYGGEECRFRFFGPLYKRIVSIRQPKLFFVGYIDNTALLNYITEAQVMFVKHCVEGSVKIPSAEGMMKEYEHDIEEAKAISNNGTLTNFFRSSGFKNDATYLASLREMMKHLYKGGEREAKTAL